MPKVKVTSKGQITVPKKVRGKMNIHPGDEITFRENDQEETIIETNKKSIKRLVEYYIARVKRQSQLKR